MVSGTVVELKAGRSEMVVMLSDRSKVLVKLVPMEGFPVLIMREIPLLGEIFAAEARDIRVGDTVKCGMSSHDEAFNVRFISERDQIDAQLNDLAKAKVNERLPYEEAYKVACSEHFELAERRRVLSGGWGRRVRDEVGYHY